MNDGLRLGMFLGGLVMAIVPVAVWVTIVVFALRQYVADRAGRARSVSENEGER